MKRLIGSILLASLCLVAVADTVVRTYSGSGGNQLEACANVNAAYNKDSETMVRGGYSGFQGACTCDPKGPPYYCSASTKWVKP